MYFVVPQTQLVGMNRTLTGYTESAQLAFHYRDELINLNIESHLYEIDDLSKPTMRNLYLLPIINDDSDRSRMIIPMTSTRHNITIVATKMLIDNLQYLMSTDVMAERLGTIFRYILDCLLIYINMDDSEPTILFDVSKVVSRSLLHYKDTWNHIDKVALLHVLYDWSFQ